jgi:hypothetical protein
MRKRHRLKRRYGRSERHGGGKGFENYETWSVALTFGNDHDSYKRVMAAARQTPFTASSASSFTRRLWPRGTPEMASRGGSKAYAKVNWVEVADKFNDMARD